MKKMLSIVALFMVVLSLTACTASQFDGSRILNEDQFMLEYKAFNGAHSHAMKLEAGNQLCFEIVSEAGKLNIDVQMDNEPAIYRGSDIPTSAFTVTIPTSGVYQITVKGDRAKGQLNITKNAE